MAQECDAPLRTRGSVVLPVCVALHITDKDVDAPVVMLVLV